MRSNIRRLKVESLESRNLLAADIAPLDVEPCAELVPEPTADQAEQRVSVSYCKDRENALSNVWEGPGKVGDEDVSVVTTATEEPVQAGNVLKVANFQFQVNFGDGTVVATLQGHINLKNGRITLNGTVTESDVSAIPKGSRVHLQSVVSALGDDPLGRVIGEITFNTQSGKG